MSGVAQTEGLHSLSIHIIAGYMRYAVCKDVGNSWVWLVDREV